MIRKELITCPHCGYPAYTLVNLLTKADMPCPKCRKQVYYSHEHKMPDKTNSDVICGCGRHKIDVANQEVCVYKTQIWLVKCLFLKIDRRMPRILRRVEQMEKQIKQYHKMKLKFIRMKNYMKNIFCSNCGEKVGNRFLQVDDGIYCGKCRHTVKELFS